MTETHGKKRALFDTLDLEDGSMSRHGKQKDAHNVFRRAFEKRFAPLEVEHLNVSEDSSESSHSESEWSGISDSEGEEIPIFSGSLPIEPEEQEDGRLAKGFMVGNSLFTRRTEL
jgi:hypothetical protein